MGERRLIQEQNYQASLGPDVPQGLYRRVSVGGYVEGFEHIRTFQFLPEGSANEAWVLNELDRTPHIVSFVKLLYRACAHGATVHIVGAYWSHSDVASDVTRRRGLHEKMFVRWSAEGRAALRGDPFEDEMSLGTWKDIDFECKQLVPVYEPHWEAYSDEARGYAASAQLNTLRRLEVHLQAHKPVREF